MLTCREREVGTVQLARDDVAERHVDDGEVEAEVIREVVRDPPLETAVDTLRVVARPERRRGQVGRHGQVARLHRLERALGGLLRLPRTRRP